jgi:hypothetical protein
MVYAQMPATPLPYHQSSLTITPADGQMASVSTPKITVPSNLVCSNCTSQNGGPNGLPPGTKIRPFTTSVSYDEFENVTDSTNSYWFDRAPNLNPTSQTFQTTYVNNQ